MSSFFSSLKKATGLGSSKQKLPEISPSYSQYEVVFVESILGLSVSEIKIAVGPASNIESRPHVTAVTPGSAADVAGVRKGDIVIALEGDYSVRFDCFYEFLKTMGRPLTMGFVRPMNASPVVDTGSQSSSSTLSSSPMSTVKNTFKSLGFSSSNSSSSQPAITEEEKQRRREVQRQAANDRTQAWDKNLDAKRAVKTQQKKQAEASASSSGSIGLGLGATSAETLRIIEKTKAEESRVEQELGYNPFQPHMSFKNAASSNETDGGTSPPTAIASTSLSSGEGSSSTGSDAHPPLPTPASPIPHTPTQSSFTQADIAANNLYPIIAESLDPIIAEEDDEGMWDLIAEVDDALAMLLSLGEQDKAIAQAAVQTVYKMLNNLNSNKNDTKLRSIRVNNKAFQSKVASVPGGVELLLAGGFTPSESDTIANGDLIQLAENNKESYLVHLMDTFSQRRLLYTLSRLKEAISSS